MSVSVASRGLRATEVRIVQEQWTLDRSQACEVIDLRPPVRRLSPGELLFRAGDAKSHLYMVESGCLCVYEPHSTEHRVLIQFAFAGDMLGLGYLENHTRSARAIGETQVTCLPLSTVDNIVEASPLADQLKEAIDHELDFVREGLARSGQTDPMVRLAAFLVALSRGNAYEGRIPNVIDDTVKSGVVASYLGLSVEGLARILVKLEEGGLIENCSPSAIRLKDIAALEQLADRDGPNAKLRESRNEGCSRGF